MKDDELKDLIYPNSNPYRDIPEPDMEWIDHEMKTHRNMTMMILHQEYLEKNLQRLKSSLAKNDPQMLTDFYKMSGQR